jgi:hypothetical protein
VLSEPIASDETIELELEPRTDSRPVEIEMKPLTRRTPSQTTAASSSSSEADSATSHSPTLPATRVSSSLSTTHASSELVAQIRTARADQADELSRLQTLANARIAKLESTLAQISKEMQAVSGRLELLQGDDKLSPTTTSLRESLDQLERQSAPLKRELASLKGSLEPSKTTALTASSERVTKKATAPVSDVSTAPDKSIQIAQDRAEVYLEAITFFGTQTDTRSSDQVRSDFRNAKTPEAATAALDRAKRLWREELSSYKTQLGRASSSEIKLQRREIEAYCDLVKRFSEKASSTGIRVFYEDAQEALKKVSGLNDRLTGKLSRTGETLESEFHLTQASVDNTVTQIAAARVALDRFDTQEKTYTALAYLKVLPFITTDQKALIEESKTALGSPSNNAQTTLERIQTALATEMSKAENSMGKTSAKFKLLEVKRYAVASFFLAQEAINASTASNPVLAERLMESSQAQLSLAELSKNGLQGNDASKAERFIAQAKAQRQTASDETAKA